MRKVLNIEHLVGPLIINKGKSAIPTPFNGPEVLSSASDKVTVFPSRTNLKLHNISVTSKMVKKS